MDVQALFEKSEEWIEIAGPDGKPFQGSDGGSWKILLAGPTHKLSFKAEEDMLLRRLEARDDDVTDPEEYIDRVVSPLVTRTLDWAPIAFDGKPFPCTPENAKLLYRQSDLVRKQVQVFLMRGEGFRKKPSIN